MTLFGLLAAVLVYCVVFWAARALMGAFGVGEPIATVVYVILVLLGLYLLLNGVGLLGHGPLLRVG